MAGWTLRLTRGHVVFHSSSGNSSTVCEIVCGKEDGKLQITMIHKDYAEMVVHVPALSFYVTDNTFKSLHGLNSADFAKKFASIALSNGLKLSKTLVSDKSALTPTRAKSGFIHTVSFEEEVQTIRNLHPEKDILKDNEMLNTAHKKWRRSCEDHFGMKVGLFGGIMKEAISVACLSRRCFQKAENVMRAYGEWKLRRQSSNKINRMLFVQLPGFREEATIYDLLSQFEEGVLTKQQFNEKLKESKKTAERVITTRKRTVTVCADDLKTRNAALEDKNISLQKKILQLQKKLETPNKKKKQDIYDFESESDEDLQPPMDVNMFEEVEIQTLETAVSGNMENSDMIEDTDIISHNDTVEEFDNLIVITPAKTYSRYIELPISLAEPVRETHNVSGTNRQCMIDTIDHEEVLFSTLKDLRDATEEPIDDKEHDNKEKADVATEIDDKEHGNKEKADVATEIDDKEHDNNEKADVATEADERERNKKNSDVANENKHLEVGQFVMAMDEGDWFKAKVVLKREDMVKVHYIGYGSQYDKWVPYAEAKPYKFSVGERVKAKWEDGYFYKATIKEIEGKVYAVLFDDGLSTKTEEIKF